MWNEITNTKDINDFMEKIYFFHDSCIKEMKYISGAYVSENLSMYPLNSSRKLRVLIQRQFAESSTIELEFEGLKYMNLNPVDCNYTCEILDSTLLLKNGYFYWCDEGNISDNDIDKYEGTVICSEKLRWRVIEDCLGADEYYVADK